MAEEFNTEEMHPQNGSDVLNLPVTIEGVTSRKESTRTRLIFAGLGMALTILFIIIELIRVEGIIGKVLWVFLTIVVARYVIGYAIIGEAKYRRTYSILKKTGNELKSSSLWRIATYDDATKLYHFPNGALAYYVKFDRDVIIGKPEDDEYRSYEALGDAYNMAWQRDIKIEHIDLMSPIGGDVRLDRAKENLKSTQNSEIKSMMKDLYQNLQDAMADSIVTSDIFVFWSPATSSTIFNHNVEGICQQMLEGNFSGYRKLTQNELIHLEEELFNIQGLSVNDAMVATFTGTHMEGIRVIETKDAFGEAHKLRPDYYERRRKATESQSKKAKNNKGRHAKDAKSDEVMVKL